MAAPGERSKTWKEFFFFQKRKDEPLFEYERWQARRKWKNWATGISGDVEAAAGGADDDDGDNGEEIVVKMVHILHSSSHSLLTTTPGRGTLLISFYRWGKSSSERLRNLLRITQLVSGRARTEAQVWSQSPISYTWRSRHILFYYGLTSPSLGSWYLRANAPSILNNSQSLRRRNKACINLVPWKSVKTFLNVILSQQWFHLQILRWKILAV